ncbi:hypothetical protein CPB84DRAFT_1820827 [Gymnopilus junonius]|uniref:Transmembrane protein n=1 Tax=Gymnopilus junonius TaxID=109634 RepID=A0A9P5TSY0_GYMJU|nr:hypothetical protein CPB84DRAFT_1820827 [Gymnopilus junonius]
MALSVLVDDTDSGIQYIGSWFADTGTLDNMGNFGPPYKSTLHGIKSDGSFSYNFQGTQVVITGTVQFPAPSGSNSSNPSWVCTVDGNTIPSHIYNIVENRLDLCDTDGLSDGTHNITVQATSANQQTFWFDYIQYIPSVTVNLANSDLSIPAADSQINYGPGWEAHSPGQITSQTGSTASFNFTGTSLTWVGFYDNSLSLSPTTATYSIDDQNPIPFNLNGVAAQATGIQYNQILFQTPQLPAGNHTIQVVYQGNNQTAPLSLEILEVQGSGGSPNATPTLSGGATSALSDLPTTQGSSQSGASNSSSSSTSKSSNTGAIIGGVVGGLALLIALLVIFIFLRARRRRSKAQNSYVTVDPFHPAPNSNHNVISQTSISNRGVLVDPSPLASQTAIAFNGSSGLPSSTFNIDGHSMLATGRTGLTSPTHTRTPSSSTNPYSGYESMSTSDPSNFAASQGVTSTGRFSVSPVYASPLPANSKAREVALNQDRYVTNDINHHPVPSADLSSFVYPQRDQDSGLRFPLHRVENGPVVEVLPPDYTPA